MSNSDEITTNLHFGRWVTIFLILILLPTAALTTWSLDHIFQKVATDHKDRPWAADLEHWIAKAYADTLRPQQAAERFAWAADLYAAQRRFDEAGASLLDQAREMEEAHDKYGALAKYDWLAVNYKDYPAGQEAAARAQAIRTMGQP